MNKPSRVPITSDLQAVFNSCVKALAELGPFPAPTESASANAIIAEFREIRANMDPRVFKAELRDMAADYVLDFNQAAFDDMVRTNGGVA